MEEKGIINKKRKERCLIAAMGSSRYSEAPKLRPPRPPTHISLGKMHLFETRKCLQEAATVRQGSKPYLDRETSHS